MRKLILIFSILLLSFLFLFMKHYLELAVSVETWMLGQGLMLHKDFIAFHFPLVRLMLLPIHKFFNWNFEIEPFFGLVTGVGTLYIIYLFGKKYFSKTGTVISLMFFSVFFWFYATGISFYHEMVIGFFLALSTHFLFQKKLFLLGLTLALAELSGQVASVTVFTFIVIALSQNRKLKTFLPLVYGLLIPISLMVFYYISKDAIYEFWRWNIIYYFTYAGYSKNIPTNQIPELTASYLPLILFIPILLIKSLRKASFKDGSFSFLSLSISTIPFNFFSVFHFHHLSYSLPILALTAGAIFDLASKNKLGKKMFLLGTLLFVYVFLFLITPWYKNRLIERPNFSIANDVTPGDNMDLTINWIRENTEKDQTLMVFGDTLFYVRSDRLPAVRASAGMPYAWEPFSEVKNEIKENPSDFWIIDEQFKNRFVKNYNKQEMLDFMANALDSCYKLVKEFPLWQVWQRSCK